MLGEWNTAICKMKRHEEDFFIDVARSRSGILSKGCLIRRFTFKNGERSINCFGSGEGGFLRAKKRDAEAQEEQTRTTSSQFNSTQTRDNQKKQQRRKI
jgi:hypothetical protein